MKELDPLLHSQLRLAIMSLLLSVEEADFVWLKEKTEATAGNLSRETFRGRLHQCTERNSRKKAAHHMLDHRERAHGSG